MEIPDFIENKERACEDWYYDNVKNGIATCSCGQLFVVADGMAITDDPWGIPVCEECFEKAMLAIKEKK